MAGSFVLKGSICYNQDAQTLKIAEQGYVVCMDGRSAGVYRELPEMHATLPLTDYGDRLIMPGLVGLYLRTPQYSFRRLDMSLELLRWLNTRIFSEEARYRDNEYAKKACSIFTDNMKHSATTRACTFATLHRDATGILMDLMEETGLKIMAGEVNMGRNSPGFLMEEGPEASAEGTIRWLEDIGGRYENTIPILTPRFIPTCSDKLMEHLKEIQVRYGLPMQSHLSENRGEISWVQELCPWSEFYSDVYDHFGLFGNGVGTIMAHCVQPSHEEVSRMRDNGVFVAHCPQSDTNLSSGVAPVRTYLDQGVGMELDVDVAGGVGESISRAMADTAQVSKLRRRLANGGPGPLTVEETFYLGTVGDGAFFGKVGSSEEGYGLDAVVLNDQSLKYPQPLGIKEWLERFIYLSNERHIDAECMSRSNVFQARSNTVPFH